MEEASWWYRERQAEWDASLDVLRGEGWVVVLTSLAAPLQLEGQLPTGESFYFRARHDQVSLGVGGDDPSWSPEWEGSEQYGSDDDASYLSGEDGLAVLRRLTATFRGV